MSATVILLDAEAQRIASLLSTVDPRSPGYKTLLDHLSCLHYIKSMVANEPSIGYPHIEPTTDDTDTSVPPVELTQPEPVKDDGYSIPDEPQPEEDKVVPFTAVEEEPPFDVPEAETPTVTKEQVKTALAEVRKKGVKISAFLTEHFGCSSFSELPEGKYAECLALAEGV